MKDNGLLTGVIDAIAVNVVTGETNTVWAAVKLD